MKSDLLIAQEATVRPIVDVAAEIGIGAESLELYGQYKAKVSLDVLADLADRPQGRYVDVTAVNPTPLGEGKTVTTVGLGQALKHIGKSVITCIRQPSLGPVFGIKGGAAGGGHSQVIPMEDINLHLTGDVHAISMANNLLAAYIDNHIYQGNDLDIDPHSITWRRVVDLNDRALRNVVVGLGSKLDGVPRETGFDIAVASEVMAILAMATDLQDMRKRLGRIVIGTNSAGKPVTAEDLKCAGAMTVLMKDAIKPNLMQNLDGGAVFVHAGPFANIAQGNNSIIADKIALKIADYVVTESGFGADMGAEKFMNLKCRASGLQPDCVVIVATVRALKSHSGEFEVRPGKPLDERLKTEDLVSLAAGIVNLEKHVENMKKFGIPVVTVVNHFPTDTEAEHDFIKQRAIAAGSDFAVTHKVHADGGPGGEELARAVVEACEMPKNFQFLYPDEASITEKIEAIATEIYGADGVDYLPAAEAKIKLYTEMGLSDLPICMAKTHLSLSHDPALKGRPTGWRLPIRDIRASVGAGFLYPLCGDMRTMPGLPKTPAGDQIDIDENGNVVGLF
ncbi:MAG: formate--tetrahydrofolate ligase [Actinomycetota bacterium]|jgi:formyltetrahydrofolate synthetase|nr:formate--tetrahydrofolate ligase [Actinomycetota bacterium]